ncbi:MAG: DUF7507 domain-containing protein [Solirubrobacteraceae bacterium]
MRWFAVLPLALLLVAVFFPAGTAQGASETAPQEEAAPATVPQTATRQAAREERVAARKLEHEEQLAARKAAREAEKRASRERREANRADGAGRTGTRRVQNSSRRRTHGDVRFSCTGVSWEFTNFPAGANTVEHVATLYASSQTIKIPGRFSFSGPTGEVRTAFQAPAGVYRVDSWAKWNGNGLKGSFDILGRLECSPKPAMKVEKLQKIAVATGPYTPAPVTGLIGETVDYEIVVTNTGNVPLTITSADVVDPQCGAIVGGGPSSEPLAIGKSTTFTCSHVLTEAGSYPNTAEVSGAPPSEPPIKERSNTVVVEVPPPPQLAEPKLSVEKLQQVVGTTGSYTTSPITGQPGQIVQYEIIVKNTGNVPLTLSSFSDPRCDAGTTAGGPEGGAALPPGASTTYTCTHVLDAADQSAGSYANAVSITGTPPGDNPPVTQGSNTVIVEVPGSSTPGASTPGSSTSGGASSGVLSSTFSEPSKAGVLAFLAAVPKLKGPEGCVRHDFHVRIKAKGVARVTFYLDKRKLRTLTAKNARRGLLTLKVDPAKLKVGPHKLRARITMAATSSTKARIASRSVRVLRCHAAVLTPKFTG